MFCINLPLSTRVEPPLSCPAKRGRGTTLRSRGVEGASASKLAPPPQHAPSTTLVWSLSPAACGGGQRKYVLATRSGARALLHHHAKKDSPPARMIPKSGVRFSDKIMRTKEGSGAPKGACHPCPRIADKFTRTCATYLLRGCAPFRGAPAFRRSRLRHSPPATTPMAQPQNRVSRRRTAQVFCPLGPLVCG
jgi:hypothetical protein